MRRAEFEYLIKGTTLILESLHLVAEILIDGQQSILHETKQLRKELKQQHHDKTN